MSNTDPTEKTGGGGGGGEGEAQVLANVNTL